MKHAVIVIGHGSRSADAGAQFLRIVEMLQALRSDDLVLPAYMELAEPRLPEVIACAVEAGATVITVVPCFMYQGIHIKEDIPEMLAALKAQHPEVQVHFGKPIGPDPRIAEILFERVEEVACQC